jgi:O-antigen ligase
MGNLADPIDFISSGAILIFLIGVVAPSVALVTDAGRVKSMMIIFSMVVIYTIVILMNNSLISGLASSFVVLSLFNIYYPITTTGQFEIRLFVVDIPLLILAGVAILQLELSEMKTEVAFLALLGLFSAWALLAGVIAVFQGYPANGVAFGVNQIRYIFAALAVFTVVTWVGLRPFLSLFVIGVCFQSILGILQAILGRWFGLPYYGDFPSAGIAETISIANIQITTGLFPGGLYGSSRSLLLLLILVSPIALYQMLSRRLQAIPAAICVISTPLFVVLSGSSDSGKGALVVISGLVILAAFYNKYDDLYLRPLHVLGGTIIAGFIAIIGIYVVLQSNIFSGSDIRLDQYIVAFDLFSQNPITGIGGHNFASVVDGELTDQFAAVEQVYGLHSTFLAYLTELGIIGLLLFLGSVGAAYWVSITSFLRRDSQFSVDQGMVAIGILGFLFYSTLTYNYHRPLVMLSFWLLAAAAVAEERATDQAS